MFELNTIPSYKEIMEKDNGTKQVYRLFHIIDSVGCKLTYNENGEGGFYLDIMDNGYSDRINYFPSNEYHFYYGDEDGYKEMVAHANNIYNSIITSLLSNGTYVR